MTAVESALTRKLNRFMTLDPGERAALGNSKPNIER